MILGLLALITIPETKQKDLNCFQTNGRIWNGDTYFTCFLKFVDDYVSPQITYVPSNVTGIDYSANKKIMTLPDKVGDLFPNLKVYDAGSCSIVSITKSNFDKMKGLKNLWLGYNQIEIIPSEVFDDLNALTHLALDNNKIKLVNPAVYINFKSITHVWLDKNVCISKNFFGSDQLMKIPGMIEELCSGKVSNNTLETCETEAAKVSSAWKKKNEEISANFKILEAQLKASEAAKQTVQSQMISTRIQFELEKNQGKLKNAEAFRSLADRNSHEKKELMNKINRLEKELAESNERSKNLELLKTEEIIEISRKSEEMQSLANLKMQQMQALETDLDGKNELIKNKDLKIEYLEQKLEDLS